VLPVSTCIPVLVEVRDPGNAGTILRSADASGAEPPLDSLADIIAGAAHDIRSPLTALGGFASTLMSRWDRLNDEQRLQMIEGIVHDAARMNIIITQLVDAARLASGSLSLAQVPTDLDAAVRAIVAEVSKWAMFDVEMSQRAPDVRSAVDRARLRTIVLAVVEAANWWGEEGAVQVETAPGPPPSIRVRRAGTSLTLDDARALLWPRAPGTGGGSKAGMFVAKALVEAHGGTLEVEVEGGITFRVTLPSA
jgi:K+-sensing histidine kinase KdpD